MKISKGDKVKIKGQVGNYIYVVWSIGESGLCGVHLQGKNLLKPVNINRLKKI
jgi:hypothetical protein